MEQEMRSAGRILVVDDERPVGQVLDKWFTRHGYHVRVAANFREVQEAFAAEEFDLVTLDIMMPDVDGLEVLRWIRAQCPDVGVIMATALGDLESVLEAMRGGAINYLIKPFNMDLIAAEVERGMERQRLIAENRSYQRHLEEKVELRTRELREACEQLRDAHARLERHVRELEARDRLVRFQMTVHDVPEAGQEVLSVLRQVLGIERATLYRPNREATQLQQSAGSGAAPAIGTGARDDVVAEAYRSRRRQGGDGLVAVPLVYREETLGVVQVLLEGERAGDEELLGTLDRLCAEAALVLRGAMVTEELDSGTLSLEGLGEIE